MKENEYNKEKVFEIANIIMDSVKEYPIDYTLNAMTNILIATIKPDGRDEFIRIVNKGFDKMEEYKSKNDKL